MRASTVSCWVLFTVSGCASASGRTPDPGARVDGGAMGDAGGASVDMAGVFINPQPDCSDSTKLVYLLDSNN